MAWSISEVRWSCSGPLREILEEVRKDIWGAVESRKLQLPIDKVYKFDDIGKAFEHMEANKHLGKIVVTL